MTTQTSEKHATRGASPMRVLVGAGIAVLVLAGGVGLAFVLVNTSPKAKRQPPPRMARLVEVQSVQLSRERAVIYAMGAVQPAREVKLFPRVNGQVMEASEEFVPGGKFEAGQTILKIDPTDYELAVRQRESDLARAKSDLALEQGMQEVAKRELEMLGQSASDKDSALALRQPQLEKVQAAVATAQAALDQAKLNLERTTIKAPFNATVRMRDANVGMQVTTSTPLATVTGSDVFWVEAAIPVDQLKWIRIPRSATEEGSAVRVFNESAWGNASRDGKVVRLLSDLEKDGRMARLLIAVEDPMGLQSPMAGKPVMILGDFVRVEIDGTEMELVAAVERPLIRDGDNIWVMNDKNQLEIRPVEIMFRGRDRIFIGSGLRAGERIITTDLSSPVEGMPLRTSSGGESNKEGRPATTISEEKPR